MTFVLGLTGSIGMGKSTTAAMFAEKGIPVWDADQAVHRLYAPFGAAVSPMAALFPDAVQDGAVDRDILKSIVAADPSALARIEAVVHPLVAADRTAFLHAHLTAALVLFDVPLLFETGAEGFFDAIAVVTAPADVQAARVLARPGMTRERFQTLLARQMPDANKRARADYIIQTTSIDSAKTAVDAIIADILDEPDKASRKRNST
jgi:dephospho-CoA kinase